MPAEFILISSNKGPNTHHINIEHISYVEKLATGTYAITMFNGEKIQTDKPLELPMYKAVPDSL